MRESQSGLDPGREVTRRLLGLGPGGETGTIGRARVPPAMPVLRIAPEHRIAEAPVGKGQNVDAGGAVRILVGSEDAGFQAVSASRAT